MGFFGVFKGNKKKTYDWCFLSDKDAIAHAKIFYEVDVLLRIELYLEMTSSMLLCCLLIPVWNREIIYNSFLINIQKVEWGLEKPPNFWSVKK